LRHCGRVPGHAIFYCYRGCCVLGNFPFYSVPGALVRWKKGRDTQKATDGMNICSRTIADGVLFHRSLNAIGIRYAGAAGTQQHALASSTRDGVVCYDGGDLIVVRHFDGCTIKTTHSPEDRDAEQECVLYRVPHNAGVQDIVRTVATGEEGRQRSDPTVGYDADSSIALQRIVSNCYRDVSIVYAIAGQPDKAIVPLQRYLKRYPNILGAHLTLAAVYSELGKEAEARAEAADVLRLNPNFSLEVHKQRMPIKDPVVLDRHIAALRKAGRK